MKKIGEIGWIEKEKPYCGPNDALIKPLALSPCTSDVHTVWEGAIGERKDMILGHEGCGIVAEVGDQVKDFKVGDRVMVAAITPDWNSLEAQAGFAMHSGGMLAGWKFSNFKDGMFGEYFHVNDADGNLALIPEGVSIEEACMLSDMVPTGFHGVELADVQFGDTVLVVGIGPVGLMAVAGANLRGASRIIAVGTRPVCREAAKKYGATDFIGYKETLEPVIKCLKPGGKVGNVNYLGEGTYINIPRVEWGVGMGHKQILGGLMPGGRLRLEKLAKLIQCGKLDVTHLLTHKFYGFDKVEDALLLMKDKPADLIKPIVILEEK